MLLWCFRRWSLWQRATMSTFSPSRRRLLIADVDKWTVSALTVCSAVRSRQRVMWRTLIGNIVHDVLSIVLSFVFSLCDVCQSGTRSELPSHQLSTSLHLVHLILNTEFHHQKSSEKEQKQECHVWGPAAGYRPSVFPGRVALLKAPQAGCSSIVFSFDWVSY